MRTLAVGVNGFFLCAAFVVLGVFPDSVPAQCIAQGTPYIVGPGPLPNVWTTFTICGLQPVYWNAVGISSTIDYDIQIAGVQSILSNPRCDFVIVDQNQGSAQASPAQWLRYDNISATGTLQHAQTSTMTGGGVWAPTSQAGSIIRTLDWKPTVSGTYTIDLSNAASTVNWFLFFPRAGYLAWRPRYSSIGAGPEVQGGSGSINFYVPPANVNLWHGLVLAKDNGPSLGSPRITITAPTLCPTLSSLSPPSTTAGGPSFTLTVNGTGFVSSPLSQVQWNGSGRSTTYVSSTQLQATILSSDIACGTTASVTVLNSGCSPSNSLTFTVNSPSPSLSSLSPTSTPAGGPSFTLDVYGSSFLTCSQVRWNGSGRSTSFSSSTHLQATILGSDIASQGSAQVTMFNPSPGGGTSNALTFTIDPPLPPTPNISSLSPPSVPAGSPTFTLTVYGSGFVQRSVVEWNLSARSTSYVNSGELRATISSSDVVNPGSASVTVFTSAPGGGRSNTLTFQVEVPPPGAPQIASVSPPSVPAGSPSFTLTVNGSSFVQRSIVQWNGSPRSTTYLGSTQLQATILDTDVRCPGSASVTVYTSPPGGGTSNARQVTVTSANIAVSGRVLVRTRASAPEYPVHDAAIRISQTGVPGWIGPPTTTGADGSYSVPLPASACPGSYTIRAILNFPEVPVDIVNYAYPGPHPILNPDADNIQLQPGSNPGINIYVPQPVVFIHGIFGTGFSGNNNSWSEAEALLRLDPRHKSSSSRPPGWDPTWTWPGAIAHRGYIALAANYGPWWEHALLRGHRGNADQIVAQIAGFRSTFGRYISPSGSNPVPIDLVCHSMGGLVARAYLNDHATQREFDRVITMGTPHVGLSSFFCLTCLLPAQILPPPWPAVPVNPSWGIAAPAVFQMTPAYLTTVFLLEVNQARGARFLFIGSNQDSSCEPELVLPCPPLGGILGVDDDGFVSTYSAHYIAPYIPPQDVLARFVTPDKHEELHTNINGTLSLRLLPYLEVIGMP